MIITRHFLIIKHTRPYSPDNLQETMCFVVLNILVKVLSDTTQLNSRKHFRSEETALHQFMYCAL